MTPKTDAPIIPETSPTAIAARPPTLRDVARAADVSTATVSRCLSHPEKVRPALRERVEAAIAALAYTPDGAGRALATRAVSDHRCHRPDPAHGDLRLWGPEPSGPARRP